MHTSAHSSAPPAAHLRRRERDKSGWRTFFIAMSALGGALLLALYSRIAAEDANVPLAALTAVSALGISAWVAIRLVPPLARRTRLRWLAVRMDYRLTREGMLFIVGVIGLALAALNTGNNLLFLIVASMLAGILVSGVLSHMMLTGLELRLDLPEHIFAGQPVRALAQLSNHKPRMPSFSLRLCSTQDKKHARGARDQPAAFADILAQPVYFPYLSAGGLSQQSVELHFPRRGVYEQDSLGLRTRFPFGFVERTRPVNSKLRAVVYPPIEPADEVYQNWAMVVGEVESQLHGRGNDLYAIRAYQNSDSVRHVDWKASAKRNALQVREFTREDQRQILLVLDPSTPADAAPVAADQAFERAVTLCASLAWHFYETDAVLGFLTPGHEAPLAPASEVIYDVLKHLAMASPSPAGAAPSLLRQMEGSAQVFKIIVTRQPRGTMPADLWSSSYIIFVDC